MDRHTGDKWFIHGRKENQSRRILVIILSLVYQSDIKVIDGSLAISFLKKESPLTETSCGGGY